MRRRNGIVDGQDTWNINSLTQQDRMNWRLSTGMFCTDNQSPLNWKRRNSHNLIQPRSHPIGHPLTPGRSLYSISRAFPYKQNTPLSAWPAVREETKILCALPAQSHSPNFCKNATTACGGKEWPTRPLRRRPNRLPRACRCNASRELPTRIRTHKRPVNRPAWQHLLLRLPGVRSEGHIQHFPAPRREAPRHE